MPPPLQASEQKAQSAPSLSGWLRLGVNKDHRGQSRSRVWTVFIQEDSLVLELAVGMVRAGKCSTTGPLVGSGGGGDRGGLSSWTKVESPAPVLGELQEELVSRDTLNLSVSGGAQWSEHRHVGQARAREARRQAQGPALEHPGGQVGETKRSLRAEAGESQKVGPEQREGLLLGAHGGRDTGSRDRTGATVHQRPLPLSYPSLDASLRSEFKLCSSRSFLRAPPAHQ